MEVFGLTRVADTLVGDAMLRGISGGERRRVTTAEMLVGPAQVIALDAVSNGGPAWGWGALGVCVMRVGCAGPAVAIQCLVGLV